MADLIYSLSNNDRNSIITEINLSNGYVNATKMCKSAGKHWAHYYENKRTRNFLKELQRDVPMLNSPNIDFPTLENDHATKQPVELIISKTGGNHSGTWVHPDVAIDLASWCSPKFQVAVARLIRRYMSGELTTSESLAASSLANKTTTLVTSFHVKPVVYIGLVDTPEFRGVKIGSTDDLKKRESYHIRDFGNFKLMHAFETLNHKVVERKILDECDAKGIRKSVKINGKTQTELVELVGNITLEKLIDIANTIVEANPHPMIEEKNRYIKDLEKDLELADKNTIIKQMELEAELVKLKCNETKTMCNPMNINIQNISNEPMNQESEAKIENTDTSENANTNENADSIHPIQLFIDKYCEVGTDIATDRFRVKLNDLFDVYKQKRELFPELYPEICITEFNKFLSDELKLEKKTCNWCYKTFITWVGLRMKEKPTALIQRLLDEFIEIQCVVGPDCLVDTKILYDEFEKFSMDKGFETIKQNGFTRQNFRTELLKNSNEIKVKEWSIDGKRHGFSGIQLKSSLNAHDIIEKFTQTCCMKAFGLRTKNIDLWSAFQLYRQKTASDAGPGAQCTRITRTMFYAIFKEQNPELTIKYVTKSNIGFVGVALRLIMDKYIVCKENELAT